MNNKVKINKELNNYRELMDFAYENYKNNIAYKYKKDLKAKPIEYIEKTYEQVVNDVKSLATALLNMDSKSKRIAVIGGNRYEWVVSYFGITTAGLVVAPMDKMLPEKEIISLVQRSDIDAVVFEKSFLKIFKSLKKDENNNLQTLICMDDIKDNDVLSLSDLIKEGSALVNKGNTKYDEVEIDENSMHIMLFTSGTTSNSKIVMLSQKNICSNIWAYQNHFKMLTTDTLLSFLPMHHTFESSITIIYGFYCGAMIAFCDGLRYIADNLKEYKVSIFVTVPLLLETMHKKINKGIEEQGKTKLINTMTSFSNALLKCHIDVRRKIFKQILDKFGGNLRIILYGAASLDKETIIGFNNLGIDSIQGYGLTETSPVLLAESETKHKPGSCGYALDNVEIKILNKDADGVGEIAAKGPNIMLGYYNDKEKTDSVFEDGYFKTGDYGYMDDDGFVFITGRKSDVIVLRNGKNIYPQELELLIGKIPYVAECMVFSREKTKTDTLLVAKIVYDPELIKQEFPDKNKEDYNGLVFEKIKEINKNLPTYKHIKQVIVTDEPMSKTTTQKIKRYEEIEKAMKELKNK